MAAAHYQLGTAVALFSLSSSSLLLTNKLLLSGLPTPSLAAACQLGATAAWVLMLALFRAVPKEGMPADSRHLLIYVLLFTSAIYCNMQALREAQVETLIVARACCPLFVSALEWNFLGRELPSPRSTALLLALIAGATGYVYSDRSFEMRGMRAYRWVIAYYVSICLSDTWGKRMSQLAWKSSWGPVLYTNLCSTVPMAIIGFATGEADRLALSSWTMENSILLILSCAQSIAISYFGWRCRALVSATTYTVIGVANKLLTVLGNALIMEQQASPIGIACLASCLLSASFYRQAPLRASCKSK